MALAVDVRNLVKIVGSTLIIDDITFSVREGEIFGLLGANGAGKSTVFSILSALTPLSSGSVSVLGFDVADRNAIQRLLGFVLQEPAVYDSLTVRENLDYVAALYGVKHPQSRIRQLLTETELTQKSEVLAGHLSGGLKRRLSIACSLIHDPKLILLDEPTIGLDPVARRELWSLVKKLKEQKKTILLASHYMDEVEHLCDRVAIMHAGRIVATGEPNELKEKYGLQMEDLFVGLMRKTI